MLYELGLTTVAEFDKWHEANRGRLDNDLLEFLDGKVVAVDGINQRHLYLVAKLMRLFTETTSFKKGDRLFSKIEIYISETRKRIAYIGYLSNEQLSQIQDGIKLATTFAIEVLLPKTTLIAVEEKIQDYFSAGAKLVWYIAPKRQRIYAYTSPTMVKILEGEDVCSAAPVIPDFSFQVKDLFKIDA